MTHSRALIAFVMIVMTSLACTVSASHDTPPASHDNSHDTFEAIPPADPAPAPTPKSVMTTVTASRSVNIREKATEHSDVLGNLWHGEVVYVSWCSGRWARIPEGWVNSYYLDGVCP